MAKVRVEWWCLKVGDGVVVALKLGVFVAEKGKMSAQWRR